MELTLDKGRGYVPAERNKQAQTVIGVIPVDSIYETLPNFHNINFRLDNFNNSIKNNSSFAKSPTKTVVTQGKLFYCFKYGFC